MQILQIEPLIYNLQRRTCGGSGRADLDESAVADERRDFPDVGTILGASGVNSPGDEFLGIMRNQYGDAAQLHSDITND